MKKTILIICLSVAYFLTGIARASEEHGHEDKKNLEKAPAQHEEHGTHEGEKEHDHESKHSETESEEHGHGDEHEHGEEENPQVGPKKGILEASEQQGIKLAPEAEKNFEIQKIKVVNSASVEIPKNAVVTAGVEENLFRYRAGYYKRIDFEKLGKAGNRMSVRSKDLQTGDEIAITGLGFIRIAEIAAFGGAPEGHSH